MLSQDTQELTTHNTICNFLQLVSPDDKIKEACYNSDVLLTKYFNNLNFDVKLYNKIVHVYNNNKFNNEDILFLEKVITGYKKNGIEVQDKNMLLQIKNEIMKIESIILNYFDETENCSIKMTENHLFGLPTIYKNKLVYDKNIGKYNLILNKEMYDVCMKYIDDDVVRFNLEKIYNNHVSKVIPYVAKLITLKMKYAKLLNYENYSDYKNSKKSSDIILFLKNLVPKLDYQYEKEMKVLLNLKKSNINTSDIDYYITKWQKEYGLNEQNIKEYFPVSHVIQTIIQIYEFLFNIKFVRKQEKLWYNNILYFEIYEKNKIIGYLYLDLFSRPNKNSQTRCFGLIPATNTTIPSVALISSFDKSDTLLNYADLVSLFHEMGHVMHHIFGSTKHSIFSGTNVDLDFVETPAQVLENFCWNPTLLKKVIKTL